jgi:hypothetical protein
MLPYHPKAPSELTVIAKGGTNFNEGTHLSNRGGRMSSGLGNSKRRCSDVPSTHTPIVFGSLCPDQVAHHDILRVSILVQPLKQNDGADNAFDKGRKHTG